MKMIYFPARQCPTAEFEKKLRARNPQRQMIGTLVGILAVVAAVALALYVALGPPIRL